MFQGDDYSAIQAQQEQQQRDEEDQRRRMQTAQPSPQQVNAPSAAQPQQGQAQQQQQAQPAGPPAATGSPVSANGQIPAQQGIATYQPTQLHPTTPAAYSPTSINVGMPQSYVAGQIPADAKYKADQFSQFTAPNQSANNAQQSALMSAILSNPGTMNANVVAQMKEAQKEQALLMRNQQQQGLDQRFNAMGRLGSGQAGALGAGLDNEMLNSILSGNRNMDIQAASTNRSDALNALNASEALAGGQMNRATSGYGATLSGQSAQSGANQFQASSALQNAIAGEQMKQAQFDSEFRNASLNFQQQQANQAAQAAAAGLGLQRAGLDFSQQQGQAGENFLGYQSQLEAQKLQNQMNQFGASQGQAAGFHNDQMAYNYSALDQQNQLAMLNLLMGASG